MNRIFRRMLVAFVEPTLLYFVCVRLRWCVPWKTDSTLQKLRVCTLGKDLLAQSSLRIVFVETANWSFILPRFTGYVFFPLVCSSTRCQWIFMLWGLGVFLVPRVSSNVDSFFLLVLDVRMGLEEEGGHWYWSFNANRLGKISTGTQTTFKQVFFHMSFVET